MTHTVLARRASARALEELRGPAVCSTSRDGDAFVVRLGIVIDLYNVDAVREALELHCARGQARIVLDLSEVEVLDPTALQVLLAARRRIDWQELSVLSPSRRVRGVLGSSGLDRAVTVYDSLDAVRLACTAGRRAPGSPGRQTPVQPGRTARVSGLPTSGRA
jgi:anti-anti-sigma factor